MELSFTLRYVFLGRNRLGTCEPIVQHLTRTNETRSPTGLERVPQGWHDKIGGNKWAEKPCENDCTTGLHNGGRLTNCFQGFWIRSVRRDGSIALLCTG